MVQTGKPKRCPVCKRGGVWRHAYTERGERVVCLGCTTMFYPRKRQKHSPVYRASEIDDKGDRMPERAARPVVALGDRDGLHSAPTWSVYGEAGVVRVSASGLFTATEANVFKSAIVAKTRDVKFSAKRARDLLRYAFYIDEDGRYVEWLEDNSQRVKLKRIRPRSSVSCRKCGVEKSAAWYRPLGDLFDEHFAWRSARFCDTCVRSVEGEVPLRSLRVVPDE